MRAAAPTSDHAQPATPPAPFRVIAHRGASAYAPENTLAAFDRALLQGACEVELDVRFSADDQVMVFHDATLDRKTPLSGPVRHYSADVLRRTDIGLWFDREHPEMHERFAGTCLVDLDAVFERLGDRVRYHIEIKGWDDLLPLRLLERIDAHDLAERTTITSFSIRPLRAIRRVREQIPICFLLRDAHDAVRTAEFRPELEGASPEAVHDYWIDAAADAGFQQVGVRAADAAPRTLARAADRDLVVRGWGVRDESDLERLVRLGAVGATVDWPDRAFAWLAAAGFPSAADARAEG